MANDKPRKKDSARLVWDSKPRRAPNPRDIEFQTAEIVIPNPQRDSGQIPLSFRDGHFIEGELDKLKMNRLIWGDNLLAMQALLAQGYEGRIRLIYLDPPFNSEEKYNFQTVLNLKGLGKFERSVSLIERLAYKDTWQGRVDTYLDMLYPRLQLAKRLLAEDGSIFVHIGTEMAHYVRVVLDEVFGRDRFLNQITWKRTAAHSDPERFGIISDVILYYARSEKRVWNPQFVPYDAEYIGSHYSQVDETTSRRFMWDNLTNPHPGGYMYALLGCLPPANGWRMPKETADRLVAQGKIGIPNTGKIPRYKRYLEEMPGVPLQDIWTDIPPVNSQALEDRGFDTQKPIELLERILKSASNEGDLVADFFVGSGTTAIAAEKLNRRWIASDLGKVGIQVTRTGLVAIDAKPFLIENIGNYQREMIYLTGARIHEMMAIILKLYGATVRKGTPELGTRKAPDDVIELVYVGYPDRPTTAKKVEELARTAEKLDGTGYKRLVVLAWDYDYNFSTELEKRLKTSSQKIKVKIEPRTIPPEIYEYLKKAKEEEDIEPLRGKIRFYEKPYLKIGRPASGKIKDGRVPVTIKIDRYVIFDIPVEENAEKEKLRQVAKDNFAVLIDYWAVDWNYDGSTFRSQWQDFRGNNRRAKVVTTQAETGLVAGKTYTIAVRVVDVFGNDAAGTVEVDLR
jgi:adenine-specific DNA-methyltransferase